MCVWGGGGGGGHGVGEEKILNGRTVQILTRLYFILSYFIETLCGKEMKFLRQFQAVQE